MPFRLLILAAKSYQVTFLSNKLTQYAKKGDFYSNLVLPLSEVTVLIKCHPVWCCLYNLVQVVNSTKVDSNSCQRWWKLWKFNIILTGQSQIHLIFMTDGYGLALLYLTITLNDNVLPSLLVIHYPRSTIVFFKFKKSLSVVLLATHNKQESGFEILHNWNSVTRNRNHWNFQV